MIDAIRSRKTSLARQLALGLIFLSLSACGSSDLEIAPATVDADRLLFEQGEEALEQEDWIRARDYFTQVRDNYPQSELRADARIGVADSYEGAGNSENYLAALSEYEDFLRLYPTHPRAAYAQFKLALVHHHQMRSAERDQSRTRSAINQFELFVQTYPNSEFMGEVRLHLREARNRLSESELLVGQYYYRNNWWPGAIDRFQAIIESDPGFENREIVYFQLANALYRNNKQVEALPLFRRLLEEFPQTKFLEQATEAIVEIEALLNAKTADATEPNSQAPDDTDDSLNTQ